VGGTFTGAPSSHFHLETYLSSALGRAFNSQICTPPLTDLHVGLPSEYGEATGPAVLLASTPREGRLAPGHLLIDCVVHSEIGSSRAIYKHLMAILINMLTALDETATDEQLIKLFPATYQWSDGC
jgi:hypothetical protein